jgi:hypothetical protein
MGIEDWSQMIKDCEDRETNLSEWEQDFIDSIDVRLGEGRGLTSDQSNKLEEIWNRITNIRS